MVVGGREVEVTGVEGVSGEDIKRAVESWVMGEWARQMDSPNGLLTAGGCGSAPCRLTHITIQGVDFFGSRVGFVKFKAFVEDVGTSTPLPGIVFARGGAAAVLVLLSVAGSEDETFAILTEQARVPVGRAILELPAGMLDEAGDFIGTAAREVEEETGLVLNAADLVDLTAFLLASTGQKILPSPGGCDETISIFLFRKSVPRAVIEEIRGKEAGMRAHGEIIRVHAIPYKSLWRASADAKVLAAVALYENAVRDGLLPSMPAVSVLPSFSHVATKD